MDNICHTLVGAALAEAGLKRRTALGSGTLMIAANFPDIDVLSVATDSSLGFRRGITHGIPAIVLLPFILTALVLGWHRLRGRAIPAPDGRQILLLSAIGILTHPIMDWMNTYGMRWFMPVSGTWYFGDALFIVDPWLWLALGTGVFWARRRDRRGNPAAARPARIALALATAYILSMVLATRHARGEVAAALATRGVVVRDVVVDPVPVNPLRRRVIFESRDAYHFANFRFLPTRLSEPYHEIPVGLGSAEVALASRTRRGRDFLSWARLPFFAVDTGRTGLTVFMGDARYTLGVGPTWASARVELP
ncbi:MAG TPA: metal-dependent hydrolase [Gemmatimonadaceae bacterium]